MQYSVNNVDDVGDDDDDEHEGVIDSYRDIGHVSDTRRSYVHIYITLNHCTKIYFN